MPPPELPVPGPAAREAAERADAILRRPEFREPVKNPIELAREWLADRIADLLGEALSGGRATWIAASVAAVGLGFLLLFLWRAARQVRRDPAAEGVVEAADVGRPPRAWRAEADAHEAAGRWRDALRCRWRAVVAELAARGLVDEVPGRTSGEYRREVAVTAPAAAEPFTGATELFERAWYGGRAAGEAEAREMRELDRAVLTEVGR